MKNGVNKLQLFKSIKETPVPENRYSYVSAIIVAAGNSTRMGGVNKQFLLIDGVPVLIRTLRTFENCGLVNEIIIAAREEDIPTVFDMVKSYSVCKIKDIVKGGETRQESVYNAIRCTSPQSEYLAIHDGARPLVTGEIIAQTVAVAFHCGAAATGTRVKDTIKITNAEKQIVSTPDRAALWAVQTPQVFERRLYLDAMDTVRNSAEFTDDCRLFEEAGKCVTIVEGSYENIKITTPEDVVLAEAILYRRENK